jgi:DNA-binding GntR family transcriptional regulator
MRGDFATYGVTNKRPRARHVRPRALPNGLDVRAASASAQIYQILAADIVSTRRKPGRLIIEKDLSAAFGVSRTPVREAILRLEAENLVEIVPQSGTFVARIPLAALPEAIVIRRALEEVSVRAAAKRATAAHFAVLQVNLRQQEERVAADDSDGFHEADKAFHAAIAEAAGYPGIWPLIQQVKVKVDRFCHLTLPEPGRMDRLVNEHRAIADAIEARDGDRAVAALDVHMAGLRADLRELPKLDPDYFVGELPEGFDEAE